MAIAQLTQPTLTLEEYMANPPDGMEWVDGKLVAKHPVEWVDGELINKSGMTARTRRIQSKLDCAWRNYMNSSGQGGEVYVEQSCRTLRQARIPDLAYLTPELVAQFGDFSVLPQSFPLLAEIVSRTDLAEEVFAKAQEYLQSSCQEIWLVFPQSNWILVITQNQVFLFKSGEVASTQVVLSGFSVAVDELLA